MIDPTSITTTTTTKPRPTRRRTRKAADAEYCLTCGAELAIIYRGRLLCVICDAAELFGDDGGDQ